MKQLSYKQWYDATIEAIKGISFKPTSDLRMHELLVVSHNESETSIVFGMYNKLLVFCIRHKDTRVSAYTEIHGRSIYLCFSTHYVMRFKQRYNQSDKWLYLIVKEICRNLTAEDEGKKSIIETRHGHAVVNVKHFERYDTYYYITYIPHFKRKKLNPPENYFTTY